MRTKDRTACPIGVARSAANRVRVAFQPEFVEGNHYFRRHGHVDDSLSRRRCGRHQAAVRPPAIYGILDQSGPKSKIPAQFNSYESSGFEFNVVPGGHNNFEIVITWK